MFIIKFFFYFSISFLILCIPIQHATVFDYLHEIVAPITQPLFESVKIRTEEGLQESKKIGKKFFLNARPRKQDSIRFKKSSVQKEFQTQKVEEYTVEEEELLKNVLKSAY